MSAEDDVGVFPMPSLIGTFLPQVGDVGRDFWGRMFIWTGSCWFGKDGLTLHYDQLLACSTKN